MKQKTPDQIRRETVPTTHRALLCALAGVALGTLVWGGGWALFHREQLRRYPAYFTLALRVNSAGLHFGNTPARQAAGMTAEQLRYALLRWGNRDHRFDAEIIRHGWYPREAAPREWVADRGAVPSVYGGAGAAGVFAWPFALTALTTLLAGMWGLAADYRYRNEIVAGRQFDGSIVATVDEYNREVKGDGMRYRVGQWSDR